MKLARIDKAIEECSKHLKNANASGTQIEAYLTEYLLVLMCAAFEEHIRSLVDARIAKTGDQAVMEFARSATSQLFRSVKTGQIAGLLGRFGDNPKQLFQARMVLNQRAETFFNNIITNPHEVAHTSGCQATFKDVVDFYLEGHTVLDAIDSVLASI